MSSEQHRSLDPRAQAFDNAKAEEQATLENSANVKAQVADGLQKTSQFVQGLSSHPGNSATSTIVGTADNLSQKMENGYAQTTDDKLTASRTSSRGQAVNRLGYPGSSPLPDRRKASNHSSPASRSPESSSVSVAMKDALQPTSSISSTPSISKVASASSTDSTHSKSHVAKNLFSSSANASRSSTLGAGTVGGASVKSESMSKKLPTAQVSQSIDPKRVEKTTALKKAVEKKVIPQPKDVGWKEVGGWDERDHLESDAEVEDLLERSTLLESYVNEKFFGDWYQNTALIVVTALFSWLVARLGGGISWLGIVLAFTATVYRTSIRRVRRNVRDDVTRMMQKKKLETDTETMEWLNTFLTKFWLIYEPVLSETVITIGNQVLADATPGFIESLSINTFTLGTKPPRVDHVRTFPKTANDVAVMDWAFSFTPNDTLDLTARQLKSKVNPKIVLGVRVGKGVVSKSLPIIVEDMSFSGLMRVRVKMMTTFPHIHTVDVAFLEPPKIDFVLKPIGGETFGFDINIIPGLSTFIKEMIDANAGPMLYAPNAFQLNVEQMLAGAGVDSSIGVLAINLRSAVELKGSDAIGNTVDPYVNFSFSEKDIIAKSSIKSDTKNPVWNETHYILVKNLTESLSLQVYDFNDYRKDKLIGTGHFPLDSLLSKPDQDGLVSEVLANGKKKGNLVFDAHYYPILEGKKLDDGTVEPPPESKAGILKLNVHQANDLDAKKSLVGQLSCYAEIYLADKKVTTTKTVKRNNSPIWENSQEHLVRDKRKSKVTVIIRDARGMAVDPMVAKFTSTLDSLISAVASEKTTFKLDPQGTLKVDCVWKPLALKDTSGTVSYIEPIGVLRVHIKRASDLKNLEHVGTIDPYVRVMVGGFQKARTQVVESTLYPEFDEIVYVPIQDESQAVILDCMDTERSSNDRSVGSVRVKMDGIIQSDGKGGYLDYSSNEFKKSRLALPRKDPKGTIEYNIQFYPAMNILSPMEVEERKKAAEEKAKQEANNSKANDKKEGSPESDESVDESNAIEMPLEKQLEYEHGLFALSVHNVVGGGEATYLRVRFDMSTYPSYLSPRLRGSQSKLLETVDYMVRELEYSQTTFELSRREKGLSNDDLVQVVTVPTIDLLRTGYQSPRKVKFGTRGGYVEVQCRYFPVVYTLDPVESINNQGTLRLEVIEAHDLEAADRSGYSDPYAVVKYNNSKVFKTKVVKKTLNPTWNEVFEGPIPKRINAKLEIEVFDWDMGPGDDDPLGVAAIDLAGLEPMEASEHELSLVGHKGAVKVRTLFRPGYVQILAKTKTGFPGSTFVGGAAGVPGKVFTTAGNIGGEVVGNAAGVVTGVGGVVVGGVGGVAHKGTGILKSAFGRSSKNPTASPGRFNDDSVSVNGDISSIRTPRHTRNNSINSSLSTSTNAVGIVGGNITIDSITGFKGHHTLQVRAFIVGKKEKEIFKSKPIKTSGNGEEVHIGEMVPFKSSPEVSIAFKVMAHKNLARDAELGATSLQLHEVTSGPIPLSVNTEGQLTVKVDIVTA